MYGRRRDNLYCTPRTCLSALSVSAGWICVERPDFGQISGAFGLGRDIGRETLFEFWMISILPHVCGRSIDITTRSFGFRDLAGHQARDRDRASSRFWLQPLRTLSHSFLWGHADTKEEKVIPMLVRNVAVKAVAEPQQKERKSKRRSRRCLQNKTLLLQ